MDNLWPSNLLKVPVRTRPSLAPWLAIATLIARHPSIQFRWAPVVWMIFREVDERQKFVGGKWVRVFGLPLRRKGAKR